MRMTTIRIRDALNLLGALALTATVAWAIAIVCRLHVETDGPAPLTMEEYEERLWRGDVWPYETCERCGAAGAAMEGER